MMWINRVLTVAICALASTNLAANEAMPDPVPRHEHVLDPLVDLDIDSDNTNGMEDPDRSPEEEAIEGEGLGIIIPSNIDDDDDDGVTDFADQQVESESGYVPLILEVAGLGEIPVDQLEIQINYTGESELPGLPYSGDEVFPGIFNRRGALTPGVRIWAFKRSNPIKSEMDIDTGLKQYIEPCVRYNATDIGFNGSVIRFLIEPLAETAADSDDIEVIVTAYGGQSIDQVLAVSDATRVSAKKVTTKVVAGNIGTNNSNSEEAKPASQRTMSPRRPDVDWVIDEYDEAHEDSVRMEWWWSNGKLAFTEMHTDLLPIQIDIPQQYRNPKAEFYIGIEGEEGWEHLYFHKATDPISDRRGFLTTKGAFDLQKAEFVNGNHVSISNYDDNDGKIIKEPISGLVPNKKNPLLLYVRPQSAEDGYSKHGYFNIHLYVDQHGNGKHKKIDTLKMTIRHPVDYMAVYSAAHDEEPTKQFSYPVEKIANGSLRSIDVKVYKDAIHKEGLDIEGKEHNQERAALILVHGYATDWDGAKEYWSEVYKRLIWLGYRGNVYLFHWHGYEGKNMLYTPFDINVENAFQTSRAFANFLSVVRSHTKPNSEGEHDSERVYVLCHSLGGLVTWDGLRIRQHLDGGNKQKWVKNVINVDIAVWQDAFEQQQDVEYILATDQNYDGTHCAVNNSDKVSYSKDDLRRVSWHGFLNQDGFNALDPINGRVIHCFNAEDYTLAGRKPVADFYEPDHGWMRYNDYSKRWDDNIQLDPNDVFSISDWHAHYYRGRCDVPNWKQQAAAGNDPTASQASYRTPITSSQDKCALPYSIPGMMKSRHSTPNDMDSCIREPAGAAPLYSNLNAVNIHSKDHGWRAWAHSDFYLHEMPEVFSWYKAALAAKKYNVTAITTGVKGYNENAIPIGEEW